MSSPPNDLRAYLQQWFPDFGYRPSDDLFFESLGQEFPNLSLLAELKAFHAWCLDRPRGQALNYRLSFRKWLAHAQAPF
jgi:hypothetical protein